MGSALGMVTSTEWRGILHIYDAYRVWAGETETWGKMEKDRESAAFTVAMALSVNDLLNLILRYRRPNAA